MSSPKIARYFLGKIARFTDNPYLIGDFEEEFNEIRRGEGVTYANLWYWFQLLKSLLPFIIHRVTWGGIMFKHNIKFIFRSILKEKTYSLINLFGLTTAMMSVILIAIWVMSETGYDKFHKDVDLLYRVVRIDKTEDGEQYIQSTPNALGPAMQDGFTDIELASRVIYQSGKVSVGENEFNERGFAFVDSTFFSLFTYPLKSGIYFYKARTNNSVLISEETAKKYFGESDPIGETIIFNKEHPFSICGILKNVPDNSSVKFDIVGNFEYLKNLGVPINSWSQRWSRTYVKLNSAADMHNVDAQIKYLVKQHIPESNIELTLQKYSDIYLLGVDSSGEALTAVYVYSAVACLILLIACINFVNLTTARSMNRLKEVGVRKVIGAERGQLINQFLAESVLVSLTALGLSMLLVETLISDFNALLGKSLFVDYTNPAFIGLLITISIVTGLLSGLYPAYILSSHKPAQIFRDKVTGFSTRSPLRKILVIVQYTISIALITGIIVVNDQVDYILNKDIGIEKENLLYVSIDEDVKSQRNSFRDDLLKHNEIDAVSFIMDFPYSIDPMTDGVEWEGKNPDYSPNFTFAGIDFEFIDIFGIKLLSGRNFSTNYATDSAAVIINKKAAEIMGGESIVEKKIVLHGQEVTVIGITENFNCRPLNEQMEPVIMAIAPDYARIAIIKVKNQITSNVTEYITLSTRKFSSDKNSSANVLSNHYAGMYNNEEKLKEILFYFAVVAILLSCLGLFSMSAFLTERRTKEIGIRKVLGADVSGMVSLLSFDFLKWVSVSNILAWPIAYFLLSSWLENYAFNAGLSSWYFVSAGALSIFITLVTITYHTLKTALTNPINTLKYE